jgi:hypothetical protein
MPHTHAQHGFGTATRRLSRHVPVSLAGLALLAAVGCKGKSPTAPPAFSPPGTYESVLEALGATGSGGVSVTPVAVPQGYFTANISVRLHGGKPNTTYTVQRAPEIGRALGNDGSCQRALGLAPWSLSDPAAAAFLTFTQPGTTTPVTLATTPAGEGSLDFSFSAPAIPTGTQFDVMFRVVDDLVVPTSTYLSGCFTVTVL